jgi:integrase
MISLLYSAGLRRGELLNLKATDIDSQRMVIRIVQGKGKKDRYTLLSEHVLAELRQYYREYRPTTYLFEGPKGQRYSGSSVVKIVVRAARWVRVKKRVTPHMLRHSFATAAADRTFVGRRH